MTLGFKDQFEEYVQDGTKRHTIRGGDRWKAGMRADLFVRPRQKGMRLLFRATVVKVDSIRIEEYERHQRGPSPLEGNHCKDANRGPNGEALLIWIDCELLAADEAEAFLHRDGFRVKGIMASYAALLFWKPRLPFTGQVIHWDFENRFYAKPDPKAKP